MAEYEVRRGRRSVRLTHLTRVFWPEAGLTKADLIDYYVRIAPVLVPHLRNRPFTIKRHYTVPRGPFAWEKDAPPEMPEWIAIAPQPAKSRRGAIVRYPLVNDELALLWMVEYGCIDMHVWTARADRPDRPDFALFDLDPAEGAGFGDVVTAALLVRDAVGVYGLESVVRTTGGKGLHVHVPIERRYSYPEVRRFVGVVTAALVRASEGLITDDPVPERRRGVFVDVKMNGHGQQIASVYSVRPLPGAPVSAPLRWEEVTSALDPATFTMSVVLDRVEEEGDLADRLLRGRQRLVSRSRRSRER
jgi:bifunctional non-homologous end joining protein LigD